MATSQYLIDVFLRHQVYLEGLKTSISAEADPLLRSVERAITAAIAEARVETIDQLSQFQIESIIGDIRRIETRMFGEYAYNLNQKLSDLASYEAQFAEAALSAATGTGAVSAASTAWLYAKTHPVQATGQLLEDFIATWTARDIAAVEAVLRNAHAQGWTMQQAILAIRGTKSRNFLDGLMSRVGRNIDTIVRTSIQHVSNAARAAVLDANKDIVIGYRWVSTLDNRTTVVCRSLDGQVFEVGAGPMPPIHPNCRSVTIPELVETASLLGKVSRAAKGGAVPANTTYYEWLKAQPASFQDSALGPSRGKLLRSGGLSAEEFARLNLGRTFKPRTLEEMRRLLPEVFNRAGI